MYPRGRQVPADGGYERSTLASSGSGSASLSHLCRESRRQDPGVERGCGKATETGGEPIAETEKTAGREEENDRGEKVAQPERPKAPAEPPEEKVRTS